MLVSFHATTLASFYKIPRHRNTLLSRDLVDFRSPPPGNTFRPPIGNDMALNAKMPGKSCRSAEGVNQFRM